MNQGIIDDSYFRFGIEKEQKITIQASGGLSDDEINKMVKDAENNAEEDKKRREKIEAKNHADSMIYGAEKSLKEYNDKKEELEFYKNTTNKDIWLKELDELENAYNKTMGVVKKEKSVKKTVKKVKK